MVKLLLLLTSALLVMTSQLVSSQSYHFSKGWSSGKRSSDVTRTGEGGTIQETSDQDLSVRTLMHMLRLADADVMRNDVTLSDMASNSDRRTHSREHDRSGVDVRASRHVIHEPRTGEAMVRLLQVFSSLTELMEKAERQEERERNGENNRRWSLTWNPKRQNKETHPHKKRWIQCFNQHELLHV